MATDLWRGILQPRSGTATLRADAATWASVSAEIFDFTTRERAGALLVRAVGTDRGLLLTVVGWIPVPDEYVLDSSHGLIYDGRFNLRVAEATMHRDAGAVLVHAHPGDATPRASRTDAENGAAFLTFMRRRRPNVVNGLLIVADDNITGVVDEPDGTLRDVDRLIVVGLPIREWVQQRRLVPPVDIDDRQLLAIGGAAQARLATATVAVVGNSGGGSHVTQQLIHAEVGTLIVIDPDIVTATNVRRLVGAVAADIDITLKVDVARRTAEAVRPSVIVRRFTEAFPSTTTLAALRTADLIIGCVDGWDARDDLNTFALTSRIPYIDIGIAVSPADNSRGMRVAGQVALVLPGGPCLRCMGLVTDARVEASRLQRQGYTEEAPEPQVVSLNGSVASEAVTAALMLLAGDDRLVPYRRFAYPPGTLTEVQTAQRTDCPACAGAQLTRIAEHDAADQTAGGWQH